MGARELGRLPDIDQHALLAVDQAHGLVDVDLAAVRAAADRRPHQQAAGDDGDEHEIPVLDEKVQEVHNGFRLMHRVVQNGEL